MDENLDLVSGLTSMLNGTFGATGQAVILRKGTEADIFQGDSDLVDEKKHWEASTDGNTCSGYSEDQFRKDFVDEPDENEVYENDPRLVAEFSTVESEERTVEDTADAICSMEVFTNRKKKSVLWKIQLPKEDPRTVDIDLRAEKFILYSHKFKLRGFFDKPVNVDSTTTKFYVDKSVLEMRVRYL